MPYVRKKVLVKRAIRVLGIKFPDSPDKKYLQMIAGKISIHIEDQLTGQLSSRKNTRRVTPEMVFNWMKELGLGSIPEVIEVIESVQEEIWWEATAAMGV